MATGTNFPTSVDSWADKATDDYFTIADCNQRTSAIEALETYVLSKSSLQSYGSRGQKSKNNVAVPDTKFDLVADSIILRNSSDQIIVKHNPSTITNDVTAANSVDNGRDQAGSFSASSWIHFYWVATANATLKSRSSVNAPPTGPTLQTGEIYWAYAGAVRFDGSSHMLKTRIMGNRAYYEVAQVILSGGNQITEQSVSTATTVPPNALDVSTWCQNSGQPSSANEIDTLNIRVVTGVDFFQLNSRGPAANIFNDQDVMLTLPNIGQNIFWGFITNHQFSSHLANIWALSYGLPNGG